MVKKIIIPVRNDYVFNTKYLQNSKTGMLEGRERVKGYGDYTVVKRVTKDVDVDKDGEPDFRKGEIVGRVEKEKGMTFVKGNKKQRAYRR